MRVVVNGRVTTGQETVLPTMSVVVAGASMLSVSSTADSNDYRFELLDPEGAFQSEKSDDTPVPRAAADFVWAR